MPKTRPRQPEFRWRPRTVARRVARGNAQRRRREALLWAIGLIETVVAQSRDLLCSSRAAVRVSMVVAVIE